jgi:DNA-binding response OmpR family regulator
MFSDQEITFSYASGWVERAVGDPPKSVQGVCNVAIVDDSPKLLDIYSAVLQMHGFNVIARASSGEDIISSENETKLSKADVALIDYGMPGMDGLETASIIAKMHPKIRIVIATSFEVVRSVALSIGFEFLKKPFSIDDLLCHL